MRRLIAFLTVLLFAAPAAADLPASLKTDVPVSADVVRLGDLFANAGPRADAVLGRSPELGEKVVLPHRWIVKVAEIYGLDWEPAGRATAVVRRPAKTIGPERIRAALVDALRAQGIKADLSVELDRRDLAFRLPAAAADAVEVASIDFDPRRGRFVASVHVPSRAEAFASATVSGRVARMVEVPVPARRIARGEVLSRGDLTWIEVADDRIGRSILRDADAIAGQAARRSIGEGDLVRAVDLEAPVVLEKSELTRLRIETPYMQVSVKARSLSDAAVGETVRVVNVRSKRTVTGVVLADGTVSAGGGVQTARR